jgi:hypothetical protein
MAGKKQDPFFTHLWDELSSAKILQLEGISKWMDAPAKLQAQFVAAARKAMHAALGAPKPKKAAARKRPAAKTKAKAKAKPKAKVKTKAKPKSRAKTAGKTPANTPNTANSGD